MTLVLLLCLVIVRSLLCVARHWPTLQPVAVVVLIGGVVFYLLSLVVVPARDRRALPPHPSGVFETVQPPSRQMHFRPGASFGMANETA